MPFQQLNNILALLRNATQATANLPPTSQTSTPQGFNPFQAIANLRQNQMNQIIGHGMGRRVQRDMSGNPKNFSEPTGLDWLRPIPHSWETPSNATQYRPWNHGASSPATRANEQQVGRSGTLYTGADGSKSIVSPYGMATNAPAPANLATLPPGEPLLAAEREQLNNFLVNSFVDSKYSGGLVPPPAPAPTTTSTPTTPTNPFTPTTPPTTLGMGDLKLVERQQEVRSENDQTGKISTQPFDQRNYPWTGRNWTMLYDNELESLANVPKVKKPEKSKPKQQSSGWTGRNWFIDSNAWRTQTSRGW